jgi:hypothetical protein
MWTTMFFELLGTVAVLALFGIQQPNTIRTQLWQAGHDLNFNSSPSVILLAYANHRPLPTIPFVWSQTLTDFNVAVSVISLFALLVKVICFIMHVWFPLLALLVNISLTAMYAASIYGQAGPDYLDPLRPSPVAWYIAKPCTAAANQIIQDSCKMAKGTFSASTIMLVIYLVNLGLSIWALLPTAADKRMTGEDSDDDQGSPTHLTQKDKGWEMHGIPRTPRTATIPYTPRTMAFNTLDRKLPLRQ